MDVVWLSEREGQATVVGYYRIVSLPFEISSEVWCFEVCCPLVWGVKKLKFDTFRKPKLLLLEDILRGHPERTSKVI